VATDKTNNKSKWPKGQSGNPAGRPPGSRNKAAQLMEAMLEGEAEQLTRKVIEMAAAGDILALRLCLDRLLPARKDRPIHLNLQPIENLAHVSSAMAKVLKAIGDGRITPSEGETMANIMEVQSNVLTNGDLERRIEQLEQTLSNKKAEDT
jgi:hypothetical protein